jgi:hypothetical protein
VLCCAGLGEHRGKLQGGIGARVGRQGNAAPVGNAPQERHGMIIQAGKQGPHTSILCRLKLQNNMPRILATCTEIDYTQKDSGSPVVIGVAVAGHTVAVTQRK